MKNQMEKNNGKRKSCKGKAEGFTFVETLAVLAITAILVAGSTVSISKYIAMAKKTAAKNQIEQYSLALQAYFLDCGQFPTTEQGLNALWKRPDLYPVPERWAGPYLEKEPGVDPWGTDFKYISAQNSVMPSEIPSNLPFVLICYGADKKEGGEGNNEDIFSWQ